MSLHYLYTMLLHYTLWSPAEGLRMPFKREEQAPPLPVWCDRQTTFKALLLGEREDEGHENSPRSRRGDHWSPARSPFADLRQRTEQTTVILSGA